MFQCREREMKSQLDNEEEDSFDYCIQHPIFKEFFNNMKMTEEEARHW